VLQGYLESLARANMILRAYTQLSADLAAAAAGVESAARRLLLAQLRSSMHPSKLLLVLAASATHLTR
jgi:hypothetical protein